MNDIKYWLLAFALALLTSLFVGCKASNYRKSECAFAAPEGIDIECGTLTVPEDRSREDSPNIQIHVAVVRTSNPDPAPDPVVYLDGGPGGVTLDWLSVWLTMFSDVRETRDLILFDQRGVGYSTPSLNCPEAESQWVQDWTMNLTMQVSDQNYAQALQDCHDRLISEGIDLSAYTSAVNAADVEDLRLALGYDQWNLYGISYGTKLALTVMRDYPGGVRSVILDSVYPPQVNLYTTISPNFERSLNLVFERCTADPACAQAFPDAKSSYYSLVDALDAAPQTYKVYDSRQGKFFDIHLNGDRFIWATFKMLYDSTQVPKLPWWIATLQGGDNDAFGQNLWSFIVMDYMFDEGMYYSVQCSEEAPFTSAGEFNAANAGVTPRLAEAMDSGSIFKSCSAWTIPSTGAVENEAVVSDIPTLVLSGEFDPVTPPAWGRMAAKTLSRSQFFEFPGIGHGVIGAAGGCADQVVGAFLKNPNAPVEASCIDSLELEFMLK